MSLSNKLNTLVSQPHVPRISLDKLTREAGYAILTARRVQTKFGSAIILEFVDDNGSPAMCFLPRRFSISLTDDEVQDLAVPSRYRFKCMGRSGNSYDVKIWKD